MLQDSVVMDVAQRKQFPADAIELSGDFKFAQMIGERDAGAIASGTGLFGVIYRIAKFERSSSRFTIRSAFVPATLVDGKFSERIGELSRRSVVLPANESTASGRLTSEDQIIASVLAGQTNEFRLLVDQYRQPVFRFARNLIGDEHDAEDITQDVFLAAFDHLNSYNANRAPLRTWLFTITRNRCVNYLKRKRPLVDGNVVVNVKTAVNNDASARKEFWSRLDEALNALPIEQKSAFVLAEIEGLSYADIARIEQTTLGTVKSRINRAKQRLRAVMAKTLGEQ